MSQRLQFARSHSPSQSHPSGPASKGRYNLVARFKLGRLFDRKPAGSSRPAKPGYGDGDRDRDRDRDGHRHRHRHDRLDQPELRLPELSTVASSAQSAAPLAAPLEPHPQFQSFSFDHRPPATAPAATQPRRPALRFNTAAAAAAAAPFHHSTGRLDLYRPTPDATPLRPALKERAATAGVLYERPYHDPRNQTSFNWRAANMAGVFDLERQRTRRERTFVGSECAVCDEPLEHTLRGERVLQFSCGHVSHEACFYEYIREPDSQYCPTCVEPLGLDTSRGGNVLDLEKLSSIVRSAPARTEHHQSARAEQAQAQASGWDDRPRSREGHRPVRRGSDRAHGQQQDRVDRYDSRQHARNDSNTTGHTGHTNHTQASGGDPLDQQPPPTARRHDYDVHSMESNFSSPRTSMIKNPVPPPTVTVRSEYPTLTRSRQQQALTCLVTVEVPASSWRPDPDDVRTMPPAQAPPPPPRAEDDFVRPQSPPQSYQPPQPAESGILEAVTESLRSRVDNWHGLDFSRFGKLRLYGTIKVGKDRQSWQELECYLFSEMLICVKEKRTTGQPDWDEADARPRKCTLKGSILIKKHLKQVTESTQDAPILTLSLSVAELPSFHLQFYYRKQLEEWRRALLDLHTPDAQRTPRVPVAEQTDNSETDDDEYRTLKTTKRVSSVNSSYGAGKSVNTAPTEYTTSAKGALNVPLPAHFHVPLDMVVVVPVSASMQGLKISLLRDALRFLVYNLGERDRMGLVTFGSGGGAMPLVGMTTRSWAGWSNVLNSIRPADRKSLRADVVEGANVAMDLLMQRKSNNPIANILLISDSSTADTGDVNFVVSRAEAAKVAIHSFGLGLTHKPDTMIELSTRTKASYTYVKDWMMLRECVAGCLGSLQTLSHQNAKLRMKLPEGSPARFVKINGALQTTKRAAGRDAEAVLGDLRFGDKRDILVQLAIAPDNSSQENLPQDAWESIVSGLEALGGPLDQDDQRTQSVEEVPLIQAEVSYGDILRQGTVTTTRPSLLTITMLPRASSKALPNGRPVTPPIPPHPSIVQRRMELLTSDMLSRALTLVSKGQHDRAHHLLNETRSILKGLGKGGLPPVPPAPQTPKTPATNALTNGDGTALLPETPDLRRSPSPPRTDAKFVPAPGIDAATIDAIDVELDNSLEWIGHPAVFGRDSRKAVLQAIGVISSQRGYTFRSPAESLWAGRVSGIKRLTGLARDWREADESLMEE